MQFCSVTPTHLNVRRTQISPEEIYKTFLGYLMCILGILYQICTDAHMNKTLSCSVVFVFHLEQDSQARIIINEDNVHTVECVISGMNWRLVKHVYNVQYIVTSYSRRRLVCGSKR